MQERRVRKAALSLSSAVLATVVLCISVAEHDVVASKSSAAIRSVWSRVAPPEPVLVAVANKDVPREPAPTLLAIADQPSIHENQRILADAVLRRLPSLCRDNLKNFYVIYKDAKQRGLGGKTTIIIDGTVPDNEFVGLLVHECGHVIHGNMIGNIATGATAFKDGNDIFAKNSPAATFFSLSWMTPQVANKGSKKEDFVTGYAQSDTFEDFSETFAMYVLERPSLEERAKTNTVIAAKLAWMKLFLPLSENLLGVPQYTWDKKVPWDATKLAFTWKPQ